MGSKYHKNTYPDYVEGKESSFIDVSARKLKKAFCEQLQNAVNNIVEQISSEGESSGDTSVYTGITGIAHVYYLIGKRFNRKDLIQKAGSLTARAVNKLSKKRITYLAGDPGPLAFNAILLHNDGKNPDSDIRRLKDLLPVVIASNPDTADEFLYGRVGYLYALLLVNKHVSPNTFDSSVLRNVVNVILSSGQERSKSLRSKVPLVYEWHGKNYYGAAHGVSGILYLLLLTGNVVTDQERKNLIKPTLDNLLECRCPSGNLPSSLGSESDRLVQWCHGAPGFINLLTLAYKEFGDVQYQQAALDCGDVVWQRGICTKGYSICHGVSGNAYTFLELYQMTKDIKHLHRAASFAEWCLSRPKYQEHPPDRPYSFFEGMAGVAYFLTDIQDPENASFPAYTLSHF